MRRYCGGPLAVLAAVLLVSGASAQFCYDDYNVTVPLLTSDGTPLDVNALFITKLTNVHLVWTAGEGPIQISAYTGDELDDITDVVRTTMASDEKSEGTLQLDAKEEMDVCLYIIIPIDSNLNKVTVEGMAELNVGPMVDVPAFSFNVLNGYIHSESEMFVDKMELVVKGNGAINFNPVASNVIDLYPYVSGTGNITFDGSVVAAKVTVDGEGVIKVGTVIDEAKLELEGRRANATIVTRPGASVSGNADEDNFVTLVGGPSCSKVKTEDKNTCRTSSKPSVDMDGALVVTGRR
jgi:hypothetical protein